MNLCVKIIFNRTVLSLRTLLLSSNSLSKNPMPLTSGPLLSWINTECISSGNLTCQQAKIAGSCCRCGPCIAHLPCLRPFYPKCCVALRIMAIPIHFQASYEKSLFPAAPQPPPASLVIVSGRSLIHDVPLTLLPRK